MTLAMSASLRASFEDAAEMTRKALFGKGFGVLTEIDVKATLKAKPRAAIDGLSRAPSAQ